MMLASLSIVALLGSLISSVSATALTYKMAPNTKECFFANVDTKQAKVAFYFAVRFEWKSQ